MYRLPLFQKMGIKRDIVLRIRIAFILFFLVGLMILYRIIKIQVVEGEKWEKIGQLFQLKMMPLKANRGNILAEDSSLLATSLPFYKVAVDPTVVSVEIFNNKIDSLSLLLAIFFKEKSKTTYKRMISNARKKGDKYIVLSSKQIGYQAKKKMENWPIFRLGRYKGGILFQKTEKRFFPFSNLAYRTIGRLNDKGKGVVGLEYSFNSQLKGKDGLAYFQKISGGGWRPIQDATGKKPFDGNDIQTTLNIDIQDITETALFNELKKHDADYGAVIVMEVKTGHIKAISNLSRKSKGRYYETYNYALGNQGSREPGSTFKLASLLAIFEQTNLKLSDTVDTGKGEYKYFDQTIRDHKPGGLGVLTVQEIFEKSSNIGVAKLVSRFFNKKPEAFTSCLSDLKLDQPLGFQLVGEGKPLIKKPSDSTWSAITLAWMSYGYELKQTPLQTLTLYNAVANNGNMVKPMIVTKILERDKVIKEYPTEVLNSKICSDETLSKLKKMMEGVVKRGTASNIRGAKYKIAGKTGTAKKVKNGKYIREYYTSFVGYFPAEAPKYSCIVVIDNPKGYQIYGSDVSAPVFRNIADKIYALEIEIHTIDKKPKKERIANEFPFIRSGNYEDLSYLCDRLGISNHAKNQMKWVKTKTVNNAIYWKENEMYTNLIPNVSGMTLRDAIYILENMGLKVKVKGVGRVVSQSRMPGKKILKGSTIYLELG